jgi:hypothetical protein
VILPENNIGTEEIHHYTFMVYNLEHISRNCSLGTITVHSSTSSVDNFGLKIVLFSQQLLHNMTTKLIRQCKCKVSKMC